MGDSVDIILRLQGERVVAAKLNKSARDFKKYGREVERAGKKNKGLNDELKITSSVMKLMKPTALVAGLGLATQALSALTSGAVSFVAGFSPAVGILGALPGLGLGLAQGFGVAMLATSGLMDAVGGLYDTLNNEKLAQLTPQAQFLAVELDGLKTPILDLQAIAQDGILPGLMEAARDARPALAELQPIVAMTATALGGIIFATIAMVKHWRKDVPMVGATGAKIVSDLGLAAVLLAGALWDVVYVAQPLVLWITRGTRAWAQHLGAMAASGRQSGEMAAFFAQVRHSIELLIGLVTPLAAGLVHIFTAALPTGQKLIGMLTEQADKFAAWSGSLQGQSAIKDWFAAGLPAMVEAGKLVAALVRGFLIMGSGGQVAPLLAMLRTDLLPVLGDLVQKTTREFAPLFIRALSQAAGLLGELTGANAPLGLLVRGLGDLAEGAGWVLRNVPGAKTAITGLVVALFVRKGFMKGKTVFASAKSDIEALGDAGLLVKGKLASFGGGVQNLVTVLRDGSTANSAFTGRIGALFLALRTGIMSIGTALAANPIGLIVIGVVLLGAALFLAYKKVEWFRNGVKAVLGFIAAHWRTIVVLIGGPLGLAVVFVVNHWRSIKNAIVSAVQTIIGFVRDHWRTILTIVLGPLGLLVVKVHDHWASIIGTVVAAKDKISGAAHGMWDGIKNAFKAVIKWIAGAWNSLEFKVPSVNTHIKGIGKVGGFSLSPSHMDIEGSLAKLALGGTVSPMMGRGSWITGEAGPEVNTFDGHRVHVQPLTGPNAPKTMLDPTAPAAGGGDGAMAQLLAMMEQLIAAMAAIKHHTVLSVEGRVLAEAVDDHVGYAGARG